MRLDTGNRGFFGLLGAGFLAHQLLGLGACVVFALLAYRASTEGLDALAGDAASVVPALLFLGIVGVGAALGLRSLIKQLLSSVRLARHVRALTLPPTPALEQAESSAGLVGRVRLVDAGESFSFAYGAFSPRVAVSRGLVESVSGGELRAVLEHERYHVRNLDPLKVVIARAVPSALFYLPLLRDLRARYIAGRELAADRRAVDACGRGPLAGALFKVVRGPAWRELETAAAIGGPELLDVRISQLETGREPKVSAVSPFALVLTALGAGLLTASVAATLTGSGGLEIVLQSAMPEMDLGASSLLVSAAACVLPWVAASVALYRWLAWRAGRDPGFRRTRDRHVAGGEGQADRARPRAEPLPSRLDTTYK